MKKLILIIIFALLTSVLFSQKKSNYEKYWQAKEDSIKKNQVAVTEKQIVEFDDLYYQPSKDAKKIKRDLKEFKRVYVKEVVDTLVEENSDIQVNTYYNVDPFYYSNMIGRFYYGGFNYWHYNSFFYDPWFDYFDW